MDYKDTNQELISIIVPVYKVERYLEKCVNSLLEQTYSNLEIILVDDGSPDGCGEICDCYSRQDARVKVIHKENGGLSDARNAGLHVARGAYISFVDSDDYVAPMMIEKLYAAIKKSDADISLCNFRYVSEDGNEEAYNNNDLPIKDENLTIGEIFNEKLVGDKYWYWVVVWNRLYKKSIFDNVEFPKGKLHEDEFTAHLIYASAHSVACISDILYYYVQRQNSIMQERFSIKRLDRSEAILLRVIYLLNCGVDAEKLYPFIFRAILEVEKGYSLLDHKEYIADERYLSVQLALKKVVHSYCLESKSLIRKMKLICYCYFPYYMWKMKKYKE